MEMHVDQMIDRLQGFEDAIRDSQGRRLANITEIDMPPGLPLPAGFTGCLAPDLLVPTYEMHGGLVGLPSD